MYRVGIIGHFGFGKNLLNGQTIKTKNIADALKESLGENEVITFDTHGGLKTFFRILFRLKSFLQKVDNIVFLPANRGLQIISPLLFCLNRKQKRTIHYVVIGGWLASLCDSKPRLINKVKCFDYVYVETTSMKKALESRGLTRVVLMPNFKKNESLKDNELIYQNNKPFRICIFSRVMKEKGVADAVEIIKRINKLSKETVYHLDIFGQVDSKQTDWFETLKQGFPDYISYKGVVDFDKSIDTVKNYFFLLFPTKFYTEGIPGTILDAYSSGVPVIASKWENYEDLIEDGKTGFGYKFDDLVELESLLIKISNSPEMINNLKKRCLEESQKYTPKRIIHILENNLTGSTYGN